MACGRFMLVLLIVLISCERHRQLRRVERRRQVRICRLRPGSDTSLTEFSCCEISLSRRPWPHPPDQLVSLSLGPQPLVGVTSRWVSSPTGRGTAAFSQRIKQFYARSGRVCRWARTPRDVQRRRSRIDDRGRMDGAGTRRDLLRGVFREAAHQESMFNPAAGGVFGGQSTWVVTARPRPALAARAARRRNGPGNVRAPHRGAGVGRT